MRVKLERKHYQWGITAFLVICAGLAVFFIIYRFDDIKGVGSTFTSVLSPFIYGLVMAYLLCPIYNWTVSRTYRLMNGGSRHFKHDMTISKAVGTIVSLALLIVVVAGVMWMVIPGLLDSIVAVIDMLPSGMAALSEWVNVTFKNLPVAKDTMDQWIEYFTQFALDFAKNKILPGTESIAIGISSTLIGAVSAVLDFAVGIIICVYFLNIKDTLAAQFRKLIVAVCKESTAEEIFEGAAYTNRTFGGFINGKIIDSAIIGVICFVCMSIFGWEYSLLVSCIIGITNIIPFFGPFIGAVPSALLLLMVHPMHALYFLIFILILQQFDGNILGPKILGDSTGLASFWVLFAILVGGGLFGFIGMVLGVPVFAVIYAYCSRALNGRLKQKGFSIDVSDYKVDKYRSGEREKRKENDNETE
ncbi:MAG: AI-2E family transporter [Firmicutes bacterium]|nr:AI-2E family transporter [Bacillota bacterium]